MVFHVYLMRYSFILDRPTNVCFMYSCIVLFWHIAKSGGTTLKSIYKCMKKTLTVRGMGKDEDDSLYVFEQRGSGDKFVNVDTISRPGILRAERLGLVPSGLADIVVASNLNYAIEHLFDEYHKGRVIVLFRHPVERLISKFYYSQISTWEPSYRPEWANFNLMTWVNVAMDEENYMVKSLSGLGMNDLVSEIDYLVAVRTVRRRCFVGLMNQMEETIHRFNVIMGIDESEQINRKCMDIFFGHGELKSNANSHPKVDERDPAWQAIAKKNEYDVKLYEEVVKLFDEQREVVESHARSFGSTTATTKRGGQRRKGQRSL
ncbi:hypothetical protein ACHAW5_007875 [Stephanodiscus triporus]|uniref:Sulfotransferase domain-containing protein n=1 Tax=Stephanodiscus triporus TaxID=2934178 RepID=A0ABD3P6D9_9STRA